MLITKLKISIKNWLNKINLQMQHEAAIRNYVFEECLIVIQYFMSTACHKKFVYIAKSICSLCVFIYTYICVIVLYSISLRYCSL